MTGPSRCCFAVTKQTKEKLNENLFYRNVLVVDYLKKATPRQNERLTTYQFMTVATYSRHKLGIECKGVLYTVV